MRKNADVRRATRAHLQKIKSSDREEQDHQQSETTEGDNEVETDE